jgi:hypothetical protein
MMPAGSKLDDNGADRNVARCLRVLVVADRVRVAIAEATIDAQAPATYGTLGPRQQSTGVLAAQRELDHAAPDGDWTTTRRRLVIADGLGDARQPEAAVPEIPPATRFVCREPGAGVEGVASGAQDDRRPSERDWADRSGQLVVPDVDRVAVSELSLGVATKATHRPIEVLNAGMPDSRNDSLDRIANVDEALSGGGLVVPDVALAAMPGASVVPVPPALDEL